MKLLPIRTFRPEILPLALLTLLLPSGCGGGGGGGSTPPSGNEIEASLNGLGIDTTPSPRRAEAGGTLPDNFNPLGKTIQVDPLMELYVGGVALHASSDPATLIEDLSAVTADGTGTMTPESLFGLGTAAAPWWSEQLPNHANRETKRAVAAADLDGDGIDEVVTLFVDDPRLAIQILRRTPNGYETIESTLLQNTPGITSVSIVGGDFDGDGDDELAIAYDLGGVAILAHVRRDGAGNYSIEPNTQRVLVPDIANSSMDVILRAGNLDEDDPLELVVLVDETSGNSSNPNLTCRYLVLDDATTGWHELRSGPVEGIEAGVGLHVAAVADVAVGNIDGDPRDEIVFGGLAFLDHDCTGAPEVFIALDDATSSFAPLGAKRIDVALDGCASGPSYYEMRFVQVRTLDLDGDGVCEVLGNHLVFKDWLHNDPWTPTPEWSLSSREIVDENGMEWSDRTNCAIAVGDVTGDKRDDILVYRTGRDEVRIFSLEAGETHVRKIGHLRTDFVNGLVNPVLLPVNVDKDTKVVQATGVHQYVFLEPIVAAVLASPPCKFGIGQNTDVCQTTFGNTTSSGTEVDRSASFSIAGMRGIKVQSGVFNSDVELTGKLSLKLTASVNYAYSLEKSVLFTTGANEDTVVFTTVPVDLYQYKVIQHPDPTVVGLILFAHQPREPIYRQVERRFYNEHIPDSSLHIDENVLAHQIGHPTSYPTRNDKNALLAQYGGLEIGPQTVGQGTGQTELQLVVGEEWSAGGALEVGFEIEAKTTITGVTWGITIGTSASVSFMWSSGHSTTYDGVVGSIDAAHYPTEQYSFGLFTYPKLDANTGQQFEVIDYWVE